MPSSVDIDYPHAGDVVGFSFPAGGSYDARDLLKGKDGEPDKFGAGDQVLCEVFKNGTKVGEGSFPLLAAAPPTGPWAANVVVKEPMPPADILDCQLVATLKVGSQSALYPKQTLDDVDVKGAANPPAPVVGGGITITWPMMMKAAGDQFLVHAEFKNTTNVDTMLAMLIRRKTNNGGHKFAIRSIRKGQKDVVLNKWSTVAMKEPQSPAGVKWFIRVIAFDPQGNIVVSTILPLKK